MTRRLLILPALVLALGACNDDESVFNAAVGECVEDLGAVTGTVDELPETDCEEPHEGEIFFLFEHEGEDDEFPGQSELRDEAREKCEGAEFADYVGVPYEETAIAVAYVTPSDESWGNGDRETICILGLPGGDEVDESFRGNGDEFPLEAGEGSEGGERFGELVAQCEGGDMAACDQLYFTTPVDSEEERIGATCGGRSEEPLDGSCETTFG